MGRTPRESTPVHVLLIPQACGQKGALKRVRKETVQNLLFLLESLFYQGLLEMTGSLAKFGRISGFLGF